VASRARRAGAKLLTAVADGSGGYRKSQFVSRLLGAFTLRTLRCVGAANGPLFLWMWPNARISVMGGEAAAMVAEPVGGATISRPREAPGRSSRITSFARRHGRNSKPGQSVLCHPPGYGMDGVVDPADTKWCSVLACRPQPNPDRAHSFWLFRCDDGSGPNRPAFFAPSDRQSRQIACRVIRNREGEWGCGTLRSIPRRPTRTANARRHGRWAVLLGPAPGRATAILQYHTP